MIHDTHGYRPHSVDFKYSRTSGLNSRVQRKAQRLQRFNRLSRNTALTGAVRISPKQTARFPHLRKLSAALVVVAGGILVTTASTGTVDHPTTQIASLSISAPTFFFDDATNALGQRSLADITELAAAKAQTEEIIDSALMDQLDSLTPSQLIEDNPNKTVSLSNVVNHPAVAALRKNATAPEGSSESVIKIKSGDTLSRILNERGVKVDQMPKLLVDDIVKKHLSNLRIGQELAISFIQAFTGGDFGGHGGQGVMGRQHDAHSFANMMNPAPNRAIDR